VLIDWLIAWLINWLNTCDLTLVWHTYPFCQMLIALGWCSGLFSEGPWSYLMKVFNKPKYYCHHTCVCCLSSLNSVLRTLVHAAFCIASTILNVTWTLRLQDLIFIVCAWCFPCVHSQDLSLSSNFSFSYCVLECVDPGTCPLGSKFADIIQFRTVALPGGIPARQDLIRLTAYNQYDEVQK
jgi:hypothetical protein